jgi:hypothetical protein
MEVRRRFGGTSVNFCHTTKASHLVSNSFRSHHRENIKYQEYILWYINYIIGSLERQTVLKNITHFLFHSGLSAIHNLIRHKYLIQPLTYPRFISVDASKSGQELYCTCAGYVHLQVKINCSLQSRIPFVAKIKINILFLTCLYAFNGQTS